ncbi:hypothetical protein LCGC14_0746580 [marine sediment metagenome]|uniref:Uncharacterized protein n=1 Tax=marine sediment metagenome TaxID=412755 RepID=A0A0F9TCB6_9ZZZZ
MNKNIYQVADTKTRKIIDVGFASREEAKVIRNELNEKHESVSTDDGRARFVVARGVDHPHGPTDGIDHGYRIKTRRW